MDNRMSLLFGLVFSLLLLPAHAKITVKDSSSFLPLENVYYEVYSYPSLNILEHGLSNENGTIPAFNETVWLIVRDSTHETRIVYVTGNETIYLVIAPLCLLNVDPDCGIVCESPRVITETCSCVCNTACPTTMLQSKGCVCSFPILFSPIYANTTELYSEYIVISRVAHQVATELYLIDSPKNCQVVAEDSQGAIIKTNPCEGLIDGMISCAFAVDDSFYIGDIYKINVKCGNAFKTFNLTIEKPSNSLFLNRLVMYTKMSPQLGGLLIVLLIGLIFVGVFKW